MVCERAERAVQLPLEPVSCDRIDAALEQLMLIDAAGCHSEPTRGRSFTLWSATAQLQMEENEISEADLDEFSAEEGGF
jgi:hypothetical protein